jgi:transposase
MVCAGIDTGKRKLDVAIGDSCERLQVGNDADGRARLSAWLRRRRVDRVGIEATGGYEGAVVAALRRDGLVVVVLQPAQVRAYARFQLKQAKNDRIDATLIAACAAAAETVHAPPDPRLAPLAEHLTLIEQLGEDIARLKTRRAAPRADGRIGEVWAAEIARLKRLAREELTALLAAIRRHPDLARRLDLIGSVAGVGEKTAVAILLRMPEIGSLSRQQAAALAGLAPYDQDSGEHRGRRHIAGGRARLRKALYAAALPAAFRWNAALVALYRRLAASGKPHKAALVACARKLIVYVNSVVARGTAWAPLERPRCPDPFPCSTEGDRFLVPTTAAARRGAQAPSRMAAATPSPPRNPRQATP